SINSTDIKHCNALIRKQRESEVASKLWGMARNLGVQGADSSEEESLFVNQIKDGERTDRDAKKLREQKSKDYLIHNLWGHAGVEWVAKPATGSSGGICVEDGDMLLYIINVYSPCSIQGKRRLWEDLTELKANSPTREWCIAGDFNAVSSRSERKGVSDGGRFSELRDFQQFIEVMEVVDLPVL
ncbi:hypothetical protein A2U01_0023697, partial [Trifolium medium]|nr:hypothetical protein [Trifolium medium]